MAENADDTGSTGPHVDASTGGDDGPTRRSLLLAGGAAGATFLSGCTDVSAESVDLTVEKLEVTQAIQYLNNSSEPDNSLSLVRGKRAFVRLYVGVAGTSGSVSGVDGRLRVFVEGTELSGSPFVSANGPISAPASPDREVTDHTLNFQFLVPESGAGYGSGAVDVDFEAEVDHLDDVDETDEGNNTTTLNDVTFGCNRSPAVAYVPIDYTYDGESDPANTGLPDSAMIRPGIGDDFMWHTYPIPEPPNYYEASVPAVQWDQDIDVTYSSLLTDLETTRTMLTPEPDFIYGWLPGNPFWGNGVASGSGDAAIGNTADVRYQRTFAHEIGHLLGLGHNTRTLSPEVGFYSSYPVPEIETDVCDTTGDERTKCSTLKDFMYAGQLTEEAWIDPPTYSSLANHPVIADHDCPAFLFPDWPVVEYHFVTGTVAARDDAGSLNPIYRLEGPKQITPDARDGSHRIELLDGGGSVLHGVDFTVSFSTADSEDTLGEAPFAVATPANFDREVASVVLYSDGVRVAEVERSASRPEVSIQSPSRGQIIDEPTTVSWDATDDDRDPLQFSVQYSPDQGETFVPLTVNVTDTDATLDPAEIPGSGDETGLLRVIATDGLNTTVAEVSGLTVPDRKQPTVRITEPKHEDDGALEIPRGRPLLLSGYAYDMEDGFLTGDALVWESSADGQLGTGRTIRASDLSLGDHVITLTGTDTDRNAVSDSVAVDVVR